MIIVSEKISKKDIMDFIVNESAKTEKDFDEKTLNFLKQNLKKNEFSEEDFERLKNERKNIFKSNQTSKSFGVSSSSSLRLLELNRDLTTLIDPVFHFSQSHLGIAKRIFNWQITHNYLSAIKWYVSDDLTKKQTAFNVAAIDAINNMNNLINDLPKNINAKSLYIENYLSKIENKIISLEDKISGVEDKSTVKIIDTDKILRGFIVDTQHDYLEKINLLEIKIKKNFDTQILSSEINNLTEKSSWLKLVNVQNIAYHNNSPKTERFTEYFWVLKNLIKKGKLLDIGCLESIFPQEISKPNLIEVFGIDIRDYENPIFKFFKDDTRSMHFEDNYFDQITAISTIEHIGLLTYGNQTLDKEGDVKALKEIARVLKPEGSLLITLPYGTGETDWYRSYNEKTLKILLQDFKLDEIKYFVDDELVWTEMSEDRVVNSDNSKWVRGIVVVKASIKTRKRNF